MSIVDIIPWKSKKIHEIDKEYFLNLKFPFQKNWLTLPAVFGGTAYREPECVMADSPAEYVLTARLPGVSRKEICLSYRQRMLTLHTKSRDDNKNIPYFRGWENASHSYYRAFRLPTEINPRGAKIQFRRGVLKVSLPKADQPGSGAKLRKPVAFA